ncbi:MAG: hypothetical protein QNJ15_00390 [Erythrobacter sp.]|nr:hypothetical protein [Erythrobacter sp.]
MSFTAAFWRFAHERYQIRKPSVAFEYACFVWACFWTFVLVAGAVADPGHIVGYLVFAIPSVGISVALAIAHRKIRLEKRKGDDALYRKRLGGAHEQSH